MKPKAPSNLSPAARKLWSELVAELDLDAAGVLMLSVLCQTFDRREQARGAIKRLGAVTPDRFGQLKPSPWVALERDSTLALQRAYHALGLDLQPQEGR